MDLARSSISRLEREGYGRNWRATIRSITRNLRKANIDILEREDAGADDFWKDSARWWSLFDRGVRIGAIESHMALVGRNYKSGGDFR